MGRAALYMGPEIIATCARHDGMVGRDGPSPYSMARLPVAFFLAPSHGLL